MKKYTPIFIIFFLLASCSVKDKREGTYTDNGDYILYSDSTTGWTTRYPKTWNKLTAHEIAAMEGRGQNILEEAAGEEIPLTHRNLLWLQKDKLNNLTSNYELFDPNTDGSYEENEKLIFAVMEQAYQNNGMQFDTKLGRATLDGLEFTTWKAFIYNPDRTDTIMTQHMWSRLIGERTAIMLNINYNNSTDRDALMSIIKSSKFTIRD